LIIAGVVTGLIIPFFLLDFGLKLNKGESVYGKWSDLGAGNTLAAMLIYIELMTFPIWPLKWILRYSFSNPGNTPVSKKDVEYSAKYMPVTAPATCELCDPAFPNKAVTKCNLKNKDFTGCGKRFCADHGHPPFYSYSYSELGTRKVYDKQVSPELQAEKFR
jgi:hypothetical protein